MIAVCAAVDKVPINVVAVNVDVLKVPVKVKFLNEDKSLLASTTNALLAATVPAITPANVFISEAIVVTPDNLLISVPVAVITVDPKVKDAVVNPVKEPTEVRFG